MRRRRMQRTASGDGRGGWERGREGNDEEGRVRGESALPTLPRELPRNHTRTGRRVHKPERCRDKFDVSDDNVEALGMPVFKACARVRKETR